MCQCPSFSFGTVDKVLHCMHSSHQPPVSQVPRLGSDVSRMGTGNTGVFTDLAVRDEGFMLPTAEIKYTCSAHAVCSTEFKVLGEDNKCANTIPVVKSKGSTVPCEDNRDANTIPEMNSKEFEVPTENIKYASIVPAVRNNEIGTPSSRTKYGTKVPTVGSKVTAVTTESPKYA